MTVIRTIGFAAALLIAQVAGATVITTTNQLNTGFTVSSTDLLQTQLKSTSFSGIFTRENALGTAAFNNGVYGEQGNQASGHSYASQAATGEAGSSAIFTLKSAFDLSSIDTYAGWDAYRGGQSYKVYYATAASPTSYQLLASVFDDVYGGGNVNSRITLSGANGLLAANVVSLKFDFGGDLNQGYAGYREIDVQGMASPVPEPGSLTLLGLGLAALGLRRRRK